MGSGGGGGGGVIDQMDGCFACCQKHQSDDRLLASVVSLWEGGSIGGDRGGQGE